MEVIVKEQPTEQVAQETEIQPEEVAPVNDLGMTPFNKTHLLRFFDLSEPLPRKDGDKLTYIHEYLAKNGKTEAEYINSLRELRLRLGTPNPGQPLHSHVYNYLKLLSQKTSLDSEVASMERKV